MNHYESAEKLADQMLYLPALVHAVLALVDRLEEMPVVGITVEEDDDP